MSDERDLKIEALKKREKKSVLVGFLAAVFVFPIAGFAISLGWGLFWLITCLLCLIPTSGFAAIFFWPLSIIAVPLAVLDKNKKIDLEIDLKYRD